MRGVGVSAAAKPGGEAEALGWVWERVRAGEVLDAESWCGAGGEGWGAAGSAGVSR